jgi:hypothetical protein
MLRRSLSAGRKRDLASMPAEPMLYVTPNECFDVLCSLRYSPSEKWMGISSAVCNIIAMWMKEAGDSRGPVL